MKLTKNFKLQEFVPKETYLLYGESSIWWLDRNLANGAQLLRDHLKRELCIGDITDISVSINDWESGGKFNYSAYRPSSCTEGAKDSQHRAGRAIDFRVSIKCGNLAYKEVDSLRVQSIIKSPDVWKYLKTYFSSMEDGTVGWTHLDMRTRDASEFMYAPALVPIPK